MPSPDLDMAQDLAESIAARLAISEELASGIAAALDDMFDRGYAGSRIKFGPGESDDMPAAWAEKALTRLHDHHPDTFGAVMLHVMGIEKTPARSHKRAAGQPGQ